MRSRIPLAALLLLGTACTRAVPTIVAVPLEGPEAGAPPRTVAAPVTVPPVPAVVADALSVHRLMIPVAGITADKLRDSFDADRDDGERRHNAIDILAPRGTPILSADDGRVLRMSTSGRGGISLYAADGGDHFVYYYAHMERYHEGVTVGKRIVRGDTLGFVGATGNASKDTPHLHFQVMRMADDGKFWDGPPINPYPLLRNGR